MSRVEAPKYNSVDEHLAGPPPNYTHAATQTEGVDDYLTLRPSTSPLSMTSAADLNTAFSTTKPRDHGIGRRLSFDKARFDPILAIIHSIESQVHPGAQSKKISDETVTQVPKDGIAAMSETSTAVQTSLLASPPSPAPQQQYGVQVQYTTEDSNPPRSMTHGHGSRRTSASPEQSHPHREAHASVSYPPLRVQRRDRINRPMTRSPKSVIGSADEIKAPLEQEVVSEGQ